MKKRLIVVMLFALVLLALPSASVFAGVVKKPVYPSKEVCPPKKEVCPDLRLVDSYAPATVYLGETFQIKCNFGPYNIPCIGAVHDETGNCTIASYDGQTAVFNCVAKRLGLHSNFCNLFAWPQDERCKCNGPKANQIQSTNVIEKCTPNSIKKCVDNSIFWFDSCGNKGGLVEKCCDEQICDDAKCVQKCKPNATKKCVYNKVYWFDSCGNKGSVAETCCDEQICENGECIDECESHAERKCVKNAVYWFDSCGNKEEKIEKCAADEICEDGECICDEPEEVACECDADCGENAFLGEPYCKGANVYQDYVKFTCKNPGTAKAECVDKTIAKIKQSCGKQKKCFEGACCSAYNKAAKAY